MTTIPNPTPATKLVLVVMHGTGCDVLTNQLIDAGHRVTTFSSIGGFFRRKQTTLLIGVDANRVESALDIVRAACPTPPGSDEHYATIFVLKAGQFLPL
ncbi:MAG: cyclic-di-AMP receptor [Anaerolineae bacterium]|nr:cyclic-di-AMP receptor [Anaerolineae bacterium]